MEKALNNECVLIHRIHLTPIINTPPLVPTPL